MLITLMFLVVARKSRTFSISLIQLMNRCAGAGREHSQTASPRWPMEIFHTIDVNLSLLMGICLGAGICPSLFCEFEFCLVLEFQFFGEFEFLGNSAEFMKSATSRFCKCCSGSDCKSVIK